MLCRLRKRIGHVLRVWLLSPGSVYEPEIAEDPDRLGYYDGAAPDFGSPETAVETAWDDDAFERWRAGL